MRYYVPALIFAIAVCIWWWPSPHSTSIPQTQKNQSRTFDQSSNAENKSPPDVSDAKKTYQKSVGAHQSPPVPFRTRRGADQPDGRDQSPMARYEHLHLSKPVAVNGRKESVLGARAVLTSRYDSSFGPVLFEQNGYSVVPLNTDADPAWTDLVMHENDHPILVNPLSGRMGIVTGTLIVKFSDVHQADQLAGREGLQVLQLDESIGVAYMRAPENYHLLQGMAQVSKAPGVERVELEVIQAYGEVR